MINCKRDIRNILTAELYGMTHGFDIEAVIKSTLAKILGAAIPLILYTDSKSWFKCLIKLDTTQEKQLIVDVMSLSQLYERQEITEVK